MSTSAQLLAERFAATAALEREVEMLHKQVERALAVVVRRCMDARYSREHGAAPDPRSWRSHRIKVSSAGDHLVVRGQFLYGDEWEPGTQTVEIPLAELAAAESEANAAEQGRVGQAPDRDVELLELLRREVAQMRERLLSPEARAAIGPMLGASRAEAEPTTEADCRAMLQGITEILYSLGTLSADRLWVFIPTWAMREISRLLMMSNAPDVSEH